MPDFQFNSTSDTDTELSLLKDSSVKVFTKKCKPSMLAQTSDAGTWEAEARGVFKAIPAPLQSGVRGKAGKEKIGKKTGGELLKFVFSFVTETC